MARELSDELCRLVMSDRISDSDLELFYEPATPEEKIAFDNAYIKRSGRKVKNIIGETRMKFGAKKLKGIGDKSFVVKKDGKKVPLHSREDSEFYDPGWKAVVVKMAPDVVSALASHIFEGSLERTEEEEAGEPGQDPT